MQTILATVFFIMAITQSIPAFAQSNSGDFYGGVAIGSGYAGVETAPSNGLIVEGNVGIRVTPGLSTGINSLPPPPELRPIFTELSFNQRYYVTSYGNGIAPGTATHNGIIGFSSSVTYANATVFFPEQMRSIPSISYWDPDIDYDGAL